MILGGGKLKLGGGNPPFPRVLYETLACAREYRNIRVSVCVQAKHTPVVILEETLK